MFGNGLNTSSLSVSKVLGGLSKTLGTINQIIPIYKEAKPMIQNAKTAFSLFKEFSNSTANKIINNADKNVKPIKEKISNISNTNLKTINNPTFFQ